ncbi:MAG: aroF, partial [Bacillota bacterium]|nr:aroF [Bacillota bacterium]
MIEIEESRKQIGSAVEFTAELFFFLSNQEVQKMIVVLKDNPNQKQLDNLVQWLKSMNIDIHFSQGKNTTILGL